MGRKNGGINIGELKYYLRLKYYLEFHSVLLKVTKITNKRAKINVTLKCRKTGC